MLPEVGLTQQLERFDDGLTHLQREGQDTWLVTIKIAIVEDEAFTRVTLSGTARALGFDVVIETDSASKALSMAIESQPQVALIDLHLGAGPTGIDLAIALRLKLPNIGLVILSSFEDPRLLNPNLPTIPTRVQYIMKSKITHALKLKSIILDSINIDSSPSMREEQVSSVAKLSDTQIETLRLMALGLSNGEIAKRRFVTEKSVEISIARLAKKLKIEQTPSANQRVNIAKVYFRATGQPLDDKK